MKCSDYTCNKCGHEWIDSKQQGYESAAYEYGGCPQCHSKDCRWEPHESKSMIGEQLNALHVKLHAPGSKLGKPPKDFVKILERIDRHHRGYKKNKSSINLDW